MLEQMLEQLVAFLCLLYVLLFHLLLVLYSFMANKFDSIDLIAVVLRQAVGQYVKCCFFNLK